PLTGCHYASAIRHLYAYPTRRSSDLHRTAGEQALVEEGPVEGEHRGGGDDRLVQVEERGDPAGPVRRPGILVAWGGHDPSLRPLRTSARWAIRVMPE